MRVWESGPATRVMSETAWYIAFHAPWRRDRPIFALILSQANAAAMARVKIGSESSCRLFHRLMPGGTMTEAQCIVVSVHEITLGHRQHFRGFAGEKPAVGPHFIGLRVDLHAGGGAIQHHRMLADFARVRDRKQLFCKSEHLALFECGLADECNRAFRQGAAERAEHRPVIFRLRARNGSVGVSNDCGGDRAAFQHHGRLHAEKGGIPDRQIGKLSDFDRADISGNALSYRGIDRVFRDIAARPEIVAVAFLLSQPPELFLHFIGGLPGTGYHFANAAHGLKYRRPDRECGPTWETVFGPSCFLGDGA